MILREGFEWVRDLRWRRDLCNFERVALESLIFSNGVYFFGYGNND